MRSRVLFATTNELKLSEARSVIPSVEGIPLDMPEIQSTDVAEVVQAKLEFVMKLALEDPVIVEDTGLYVKAWNGLPGAFIKWFIDGMTPDGFAALVVQDHQGVETDAVSAVGVVYRGETSVWTGKTRGRIVRARGEERGWNSIFEESVCGRTFGELNDSERLTLSMRRRPLEDVRSWLAERGITIGAS
jgi:non-canonical purine NTP pyrophosphatase (RdgB/HAM1 family)